MDLAAIYEKYQVIINLFSAVVIAVLGYLFGKWDSERKRKWELEDRDYKRKIELKDKRIAEAHEYMELQAKLSLLVAEMGKMILKPLKQDEHKSLLTEYKAYQENMSELQDKLIPLSSCFGALEDLALIKMASQLVSDFRNQRSKISSWLTDVINEKPINRDTLKNDLREYNKKSARLYHQIQSRLHELANSIE